MMPEKTVIDEFNEIEVDTSTKLADLQETYNTAKDLIAILKEIESETVTLQDGSTISLSNLFGELGEIEKSGGNIQEYIESLGLDVDYVVLQYNKWKEATRQLTSLVPSLSAVIDNETGAINGGTDALQKNLDEWKKNEENKIYWAEYYAKAEAVARAKGEQAGIQIEAEARKRAAERARQEVEKQAATLGINIEWYEGDYEKSKFGGQANVRAEEQNAYNDAVDKYIRLRGEADRAQKKAENSANDLADAEELLADELAATEEITGQTLATVQQLKDEEDAAADAAEEWGEETKKAGKDAVTAAESALKALADYVQGVKDSTAQAVNSIVKGFEKVNRAGDETRQKSNELATQEAETLNKYTSVWAKWGSDNASLKKMAASWDSLSKEEQSAYEELVKIRNAQKEVNDALGKYSPEGMKSGLQSQIDYMTEYLDNLKKAQEMGLSNELLASLSDGSTESAEYLAGLVEAGPEAAQAVDELYQEVQAQKKSFTDALAEQKLAADETYDALVQKALQTVEDLNLGDEAESAMSDTVGGIAQGIADKVPEVQAAVDAIEEQLNRLAAWGFSFNFGDGGFSLTLDGEHETGLDYVPFDGYLAGLHEGEGILTAEENRIWQRFKNGQSSTGNVDYDALGGVMRENVKAGGNVYLDGRTVGQVISMEQARSYRSLKRSGWQG
jgi:hypothetical protein